MAQVGVSRTGWKAGALALAAGVSGGVAARALGPLPVAVAQDRGPGAPGDPAAPRAGLLYFEVYTQGIPDVVRYHHVTQVKIEPGTPAVLAIKTQDGKSVFFTMDKVVYYATEAEDEKK